MADAPTASPAAAPTASTPTTPSSPAAPTSTPTSPTSTPDVSTSAPSGESFDNLGSADDLDVVVEVPSVAPAAAPAEGGEAASKADAGTGEPPKPADAATKPPPAAAEPAKEPPKEPAKAAPPTPAPAQVDDSPQGLVQQLAQHREDVLAALAGDRFKLSEAEVKALDTDAVGAIPRVMARVYYESMQSTLLHIQNLVPQMVANVIKAQKASDEIENAFYGKFSALDRSKHANDVAQFARMMRGANPQISQDDLFAMVGAAVMAKHGLTGAPPAAAHTGNGTTPPRPPQPPPFVPAQSGASVRVVPEAESPWAGMGRDFDDE